MNNEEEKYNRKQPVNKNTWILLIILSIVVICIAIYQINTPSKGGSVDYLTILLSVVVILSSLFNIFKKKK